MTRDLAIFLTCVWLGVVAAACAKGPTVTSPATQIDAPFHTIWEGSIAVNGFVQRAAIIQTDHQQCYLVALEAGLAPVICP